MALYVYMISCFFVVVHFNKWPTSCNKDPLTRSLRLATLLLEKKNSEKVTDGSRRRRSACVRSSHRQSSPRSPSGAPCDKPIATCTAAGTHPSCCLHPSFVVAPNRPLNCRHALLGLRCFSLIRIPLLRAISLGGTSWE